MTVSSIRRSWYSRLINFFLIATFVTTMVITPRASYAQGGVMGLPRPGAMVNLSPAYVPLMVSGLTIHPENPLLMDFIVSTGNSGLKADSSAASLLDALAETVAWLTKNYGISEVTYGQVNRIRRGGRSWPFSGGDSGGGMTLRAMASKLEGKAFYGESGQNWTQLVQFRRGAVRSWSATPFGQSDEPDSPHYADQAEKLFSAGHLKPTWFQSAELEGNVESVKVLHRRRK